MNSVAQILINDQKIETAFSWGWLRETMVTGSGLNHHQGSGIRLCAIREYRLEEGEEMSISFDEDDIVIILPLVNDLQLELRRFQKLLSVGEVSLFDVNQSDIMQVTADPNQTGGLFFQLFLFKGSNGNGSMDDVAKLPIGDLFPINTVLPIQPSQFWPMRLYFGTFQTKFEDVLSNIADYEQVFAYCLEGCFEVEKRLLFQGDGLLIRELKMLDVECLSEKGLIILVVL